MAATVNPFVLFVRRNAFVTFCVALGLVVGGVCAYLWHRSTDLEVRNRQRTIEGETMLAMVGAGPRLREHHTVARAAVERIEANLAVEPNLADNLYPFYTHEQASGIRFTELRQLNSPPIEEGEPYKVVPFSLTANGTFDQVSRFIHLLETSPRIVRVLNFNLQRQGPEGASLSLNLTVQVLARP